MTTKNPDVNISIAEWNLPDPILTENVDYHERPDWKKRLAAAEPRIKEACDAIQARHPDDPDAWNRTYKRLTDSIGFPKDLVCDNFVHLERDEIYKPGSERAGKCRLTERTDDCKHFAYRYNLVEFDFGHECRLNCGLPIFTEDYQKVVGTKKLRCGRMVRSDADLKQWISEQVPFTFPEFRTADFLGGILKGKWTMWIGAVKNVCIELSNTEAGKKYWKELSHDWFQYLMYRCFELNQYVFPIEDYDSSIHKALRIIIRAMELVRGVKFRGDIVFIENFNKYDPIIVQHGSCFPTVWTWGAKVDSLGHKKDSAVVGRVMQNSLMKGELKYKPNRILYVHDVRDGKRQNIKKYVYFNEVSGEVTDCFWTDYEGNIHFPGGKTVEALAGIEAFPEDNDK